MNSDVSGQRWLTNDDAQDVDPTWSPDGVQIAFVPLTPGTIVDLERILRNFSEWEE